LSEGGKNASICGNAIQSKVLGSVESNQSSLCSQPDQGVRVDQIPQVQDIHTCIFQEIEASDLVIIDFQEIR